MIFPLSTRHPPHSCPCSPERETSSQAKIGARRDSLVVVCSEAPVREREKDLSVLVGDGVGWNLSKRTLVDGKIKHESKTHLSRGNRYVLQNARLPVCRSFNRTGPMRTSDLRRVVLVCRKPIRCLGVKPDPNIGVECLNFER